MPRMNLEGSSSIITGGASGIGEASARQLAAAGSHVVIADLNEEKGQAVASELGPVCTFFLVPTGTCVSSSRS